MPSLQEMLATRGQLTAHNSRQIQLDAVVEEANKASLTAEISGLRGRLRAAKNESRVTWAELEHSWRPFFDRHRSEAEEARVELVIGLVERFLRRERAGHPAAAGAGRPGPARRCSVACRPAPPENRPRPSPAPRRRPATRRRRRPLPRMLFETLSFSSSVLP